MIRSAIVRIKPVKPTDEPKPPRGPRRRKCKVCRALFVPRSITHKACGSECALAVAEGDRKAKERKSDRARRAAVKTRSDHIADTQVAFNALVRARDADQVCISCDTVLSTLAGTPGGGFDAGHYRSRGSAPHLRFDFRNCHGQCKKCNRYKSGNAADYRINLVVRIGREAVEALESDQSGGKWTVAELLAMKADFKAQLKTLTARRGNGEAQQTAPTEQGGV